MNLRRHTSRDMTATPARHSSRRRVLMTILNGSALIATAMAASSPVAGQDADCKGITDDDPRLRCYQPLIPPSSNPPVTTPLTLPPPQSIGRWRLIHAANPLGGKHAVSIMRTGEFGGSDANFAGLMIRCADP